MANIFDRIQACFKPNENWSLKTELEFRRQREMQALWVGIIAFGLPALLYFANRAAPCFRDSISHTYYMPFWGDVFVVLTSFVGLLLLFYRGQSKAERWLAIIAGICAVTVALSPTDGSGCETTYVPSRIFLHSDMDNMLAHAFNPGEWFPFVHVAAASGLFISLAIFSLFVFTATDETNPYQRERKNRNKKIRNAIYKITGFVMPVIVIALGLRKLFNIPDCDIIDIEMGIGVIGDSCPTTNAWDYGNWTFGLEWLALAMFGIAWFVKGRGGGFLLLDEKPDQFISRPWWWEKSNRDIG